MSKIEIHIITYNEEMMLPCTIDHYKRMFADPIIVIHDNESTDNTVKIATEAGCKVIPFITNGLTDSAYVKIKSEAHLTASTDWCLCVDCDEHCYINNDDLLDLEKRKINLVEFEGWEIFANVDSPSKIKEFKGFRTGGYDKPLLVKVGSFKEYSVAPGAHKITKLLPVEGVAINISKQEFKLLHMKHWNLQFIIDRQAEFGRRLSNENKMNGWGQQYTFSAEIHTQYFNNGLSTGTLITDKRFLYA